MNMTGVQYNTAGVKVRTVFYTGSTALAAGYGVCYERDFIGTGTGELVTNASEKRDFRVELPNTDNYKWFAGVVAKPYGAVTGGQLIDIYEPGSVCPVYVGDSSCTAGTTRVTCACAPSTITGQFYNVYGPEGRGAAKILQTLSAAGLALAYLEDGAESGLYQRVVVTAVGATGVTLTSIGVTAFDLALQDATLSSGTLTGTNEPIGALKCFSVYATGAAQAGGTGFTITAAGYKIGTTAGSAAAIAVTKAVMGASGSKLVLRWDGSAWREQGSTSTTLV